MGIKYNMENKIIIYADGACRGNNSNIENIGAYAYIINYRGHIKSCAWAFRNVTNNQMELVAVITALLALKENAKDHKIEIHSDSQYVIKGINEWSKKWVINNFMDVKNPDLWKDLLNIISKFPDIEFIWIKGHSDDYFNNYVDNLCNQVMGKIESNDHANIEFRGTINDLL